MQLPEYVYFVVAPKDPAFLSGTEVFDPSVVEIQEVYLTKSAAEDEVRSLRHAALSRVADKHPDDAALAEVLAYRKAIHVVIAAPEKVAHTRVV